MNRNGSGDDRFSTRALRRPSPVLLFLLAWLVVAGSAIADTTVRVLETWPPGNDVTLGQNGHFYLRLAYETDKPVGIWVAPYFRGKRANAGSNPSQRYTGSGETFGWFFFMKPGDEVDEIRISAGDGGTSSTPVVAIWRGRVIGSNAAERELPQPAWIAEVSAREKAAQDEAYKAQMSKPTSVGDVALISGFMLAMLALGLAGFAAPAWGVWRWRGGWRVGAALPAAMMVLVVLNIGVGVARDATSHNLWPFEILQAGLASLVVMTILFVAQKLYGTRR